MLVAGGDDGKGGEDSSPLNTAELYDPHSGTWSVTGNLNDALEVHTATLLQDGKVLVAGGCPEGHCQDYTASADVYDPKTETWSSTGSLNKPRSRHALTMLPNGDVLVSGGDGQSSPFFKLSAAEIYNPVTGLWSTTGNLSTARSAHVAALLQNGKVLVVGGLTINPGVQFDAVQNRFIARPIDLGPESDQVYLLLFGTGIRSRSSLSGVIATIDGEYSAVSFAGGQSDFAGLDQVNVLVTRSLMGRGEVDVLLTVEAQMANPVKIHIK